MSTRALRGATTVDENSKTAIFDASQELVAEIIAKNKLDVEDMEDILFTITPDLTAAFPAAAIRRMGITNVPLLDMAAPNIDGALKMCIRVLIHIRTDKSNAELNHIYLRGAKALRPDIAMAKKKISIAIDGPAGAGKSSIAKTAANELGYVYIDTGAMYRTVAVYAIQNNINLDTEMNKLEENFDNIKIDIKYVGNEQRMFLCGEDVTERIRQNDASMGASKVAAMPFVREKLVSMQREMSKKGGIIMDGRDIGTTVLPGAELKIYLTASVEERAERRYKQCLEKGIKCDFEELKQEVIQRDENDMNRAVSPLKKAPDAALVDSTELSFDETVELIESMIKRTEEECI